MHFLGGKRIGKTKTTVAFAVLVIFVLLSGCASLAPSGSVSLYEGRYDRYGGVKSRVGGDRAPTTPNASGKGNGELEGVASWYGPGFHGRRTANGEIYNMNIMTAAHKTLPFDTIVRVTNLDNGLSVVVRINDRGPFVKGRIIDLSRSAAEEIGMIGPGTAQVQLKILSHGG